MKKATVDLNKLTQLRKEKGYSISQLSTMLGYKTPTGYWLIEKGERKVSVSVLYQLSKLYKITMENMLLLKD